MAKLVQLPAVLVDCLMYHPSLTSDEEKEMFLAWIKWLLVTSRSHGRTNKLNINIMMCTNTKFAIFFEKSNYGFLKKTAWSQSVTINRTVDSVCLA